MCHTIHRHGARSPTSVGSGIPSAKVPTTISTHTRCTSGVRCVLAGGPVGRPAGQTVGRPAALLARPVLEALRHLTTTRPVMANSVAAPGVLCAQRRANIRPHTLAQSLSCSYFYLCSCFCLCLCLCLSSPLVLYPPHRPLGSWFLSCSSSYDSSFSQP